MSRSPGCFSEHRTDLGLIEPSIRVRSSGPHRLGALRRERGRGSSYRSSQRVLFRADLLEEGGPRGRLRHSHPRTSHGSRSEVSRCVDANERAAGFCPGVSRRERDGRGRRWMPRGGIPRHADARTAVAEFASRSCPRGTRGRRTTGVEFFVAATSEPWTIPSRENLALERRSSCDSNEL